MPMGNNVGKLPPQALELEQVILGALLIDKRSFDDVIDILKEEFFYKKENQIIFKAIYNLFSEGNPVDILIVSEYLKKQNKLDEVGGDPYLVELSQKVSSSAHIVSHSRIIQQKYIQRELIRICSNIIRESYNDHKDVFDILDFAESRLFELTDDNIKNSYQKLSYFVSDAINNMEKAASKEGLNGIPSGFREIDKITSGWQNSDLIILAARPGMGKTAFALSMARNLGVDYGIPVAVFSLEMSAIQLITRFISSETEIDQTNLIRGNLKEYEWEQLRIRTKKLEKAPIYIDDTPDLSIFDMRAKCRRLVRSGVKLVIVDYLQIMGVDKLNRNANREREIATISRNLKSLAKDLNIPIIALSQLSREVEKRGGTKRPMLSDLRESGTIEQDADIVSFIYRPEYYKMETWDDDEGTPCQGQAEFIIAKNRNGITSDVKLKFVARYAKFANIDDYAYAEIESRINKADRSVDVIDNNMPF